MYLRIIDLINRNDLKGIKKEFSKLPTFLSKHDYILHACYTNKLNILKYLVSISGNELSKQVYGELFEIALGCGDDLDIIKFIINTGKIEVRRGYVDIACEFGYLHIVKYFMEEYFHEPIITFDWDLIDVCIRCKDIQICTYLLSRGNISIHGYHITLSLIGDEDCFMRLFLKKINHYGIFIRGYMQYGDSTQDEQMKYFTLYNKMKDQVLLLYRIHDSKIPIELQKIIFDYI